MQSISSIAVAAIAATATPASAQPYYPEAMPITVHAPPLAYAPPPPNPFVALGTGIGGAAGALAAAPFNLLGGFFGALFGPHRAGQGGWAPVTNSRYDPATGEFLPPVAYAPAPTGPPRGYEPYPVPGYVEPPPPYQGPGYAQPAPAPGYAYPQSRPDPYPEPPQVHAKPRVPHNSRSGSCYDSRGTLVSPLPEDCRG
jgi:hypothetical protein